MFEKHSIRCGLFFTFSASLLAMSACSTQGASRYGDVNRTAPVPCGTVMVPCGQIIEYHRVQVQPPSYLVPVPCPTGRCLPPQPPRVQKPPVTDPPVVMAPPAIIEPPAVVEPPYVPLVIAEPPYEPPVVEPPVLRSPTPPPVPCPPGTIPGYGGQDCIPITVPRK